MLTQLSLEYSYSFQQTAWYISNFWLTTALTRSSGVVDTDDFVMQIDNYIKYCSNRLLLAL